MSFAYAAVALVQGQTNAIALDYSPAALAACAGLPRKTRFLEGTFPDGATVCINCGTQIDDVYASPLKACIAKCRDSIDFDGNGPVPPEGTTAFCEAHVTLSTNTEPDTCYLGACTDGGNPNSAWDDPRHHQEKVVWSPSESVGVEFFGADNNSIRRNAATTGNTDSDFNAGSASSQLITKGDGWVEFKAGQIGVSHVIGLRESCDNILTCPDGDAGLTGIGFAISLNNNNSVYVLEAGTPLVLQGPFGAPYTDVERFRVQVTDNNNGTGTISYVRLDPGCMDGTECTGTVIYTSPTLATYPLRVDVTFREVDATLEDVTIVRIKQ